ncbi:DNA-directed RNA polymerase subunit alpha [Candidatus Shapirobacteria bacterium CG08_land_8_20_14_0_20_39_18]|uniref:DNA-directed RNA polymerase subunit alpha n=1 Tax=Candidatus Shapirobacteria bacterium CG08_land_8_20_14_0_20_39_18 TaxID=1974883 RepID=A0A2M6XEA4_9BACT|nr:MAG: DNA-directed RNA polymerase subunit alpha [Candidatus Shapirobacteria bacterium CG08_land_8_20_14_0_20_39_18]PIY66429.1 MAG: DNA-directed RNA polymerase subunit alpha [Candidatus Shapirobacteria bacterium CG_4_10_14_0_8_um_filter_39_15]PJE68401.1 MAG: DNA-directed RNA polymerase subunit alpha [Candidatus Shapirobacteria bacterium CG10_big_fil_rev_8_21_14_0_10_38_8]
MLSPIFQIKNEKSTDHEGIFIIEPLEQGYGHTVGNALRRVLLTSLPGAAVTYVKIAGVFHQFTSLEGMKEDVVELILNIKKIRFAYEGEKPVKVTLEAIGPGEVKAEEIKTPANVKVVSKDLVLANLSDKKSKLDVEMTVEKGYGYSPFEDRESQSLGVIPVDAAFSPILSVNYRIEATRVGRITNYDRLVMEILSDGSIKPIDALKEAAKILITYFNQIIEPRKVEEEQKPKEEKVSREALNLMIEELNLPVRISNALERAGFKTVADVLASNKKEIAKVKNLGSKSLKIIEAGLKEKGVGFEE